MAKKLVKKRRIIPWGLLILVFIIAWAVCDITNRSVSGGMTLIEWSSTGVGLAAWIFILLKYLASKNMGGEKWQNRLRLGSWLALALMGFSLLLLMYMSGPYLGR